MRGDRDEHRTLRDLLLGRCWMPDPTTDFGIFDHQELVTWNAGTGPIAGIRAVRRPLTQTVGRRIERFVSLNADDVVFHLDAAPLAGVALAAGMSCRRRGLVRGRLLSSAEL